MSASNETQENDFYLRAVRGSDGRFTNNFNPEFQMPQFGSVLKWKVTEKNQTNLPNAAQLEQMLPIIRHEKGEVFVNSEGLHFMWIGHASCLVQMDDFVFLTDPVFSERCGITSWIGPKRYRPAALQVDELPKQLDAVLISHNHFDHLDLPSVKKLHERYGESIQWFCGEGLRDWFQDCGIRNVVEMNWTDDHTFEKKPNVTISFCPAQHWSRRGLSDQNQTLWGGYAVSNGKYRFYFAGDTGYTDDIKIFKQIGKKYGPFDLSAIPIGAYQPRWMMKSQHVSPVEAVQIHLDIKSKKSIGIHWGTWALADEFYLEPKTRLAEVVSEKQLDPNSFVTVKHGEIIDLPENH